MISDQDYIFKSILLEDVQDIYELEILSYPLDEAATLEKIKYRAIHASEYFYSLKDIASSKLIGFINGTCTTASKIHHESMSEHVINGRTLVIHSVVVSPTMRRKGIATYMLKKYLFTLHQQQLIDKVLLLSKVPTMPLYLSVGFRFYCISSVEHGSEKWAELGLTLKEHFGKNVWQVDAFVKDSKGKQFDGNPAAVLLEHGDESWMQSVAMENNLSETSFLSKISDGLYKLRWFTPIQEVELCGHATLAAAHVLYETGEVAPLQPVRFETLHSGILLAQQLSGSCDIQLDFPATPVTPIVLTEKERAHLLAGFSLTDIDIIFTGRSLYDLVVEVTLKAFSSLGKFDFKQVEELEGRGVIITSKYEFDDAFNVASRCFFPRYGINEDPVTGSAHCALAPYWFNKLQLKECDTLLAYQASARGGALKIRLENDRVKLAGTCVTTLKSILLK